MEPSWGFWPWHTAGEPEQQQQQQTLFPQAPRPQKQQPHPQQHEQARPVHYPHQQQQQQNQQLQGQQQKQQQKQQPRGQQRKEQQGHQPQRPPGYQGQQQDLEAQGQVQQQLQEVEAGQGEYPQHLNPFLSRNAQTPYLTVPYSTDLEQQHPPQHQHHHLRQQVSQHHHGQPQTFQTLPGAQLPMGQPPLAHPHSPLLSETTDTKPFVSSSALAGLTPSVPPYKCKPSTTTHVPELVFLMTESEGLPVLPSLPWSHTTSRGPTDPSKQGLRPAEAMGPMDPLKQGLLFMGPMDPLKQVVPFTEAMRGPMGPLAPSLCDAGHEGGYEGGASDGVVSGASSSERDNSSSEGGGTPERATTVNTPQGTPERGTTVSTPQGTPWASSNAEGVPERGTSVNTPQGTPWASSNAGGTAGRGTTVDNRQVIPWASSSAGGAPDRLRTGRQDSKYTSILSARAEGSAGNAPGNETAKATHAGYGSGSSGFGVVTWAGLVPRVTRDESPEPMSAPESSSGGHDTDANTTTDYPSPSTGSSQEDSPESSPDEPSVPHPTEEKGSEALFLASVRHKARRGRPVRAPGARPAPAGRRGAALAGMDAGVHLAAGHVAAGHVAAGHVATGHAVAGGHVAARDAGGVQESLVGSTDSGGSVGGGERRGGSGGVYSDTAEESRDGAVQYSDTRAGEEEEDEDDEEIPLLLLCRPCHKKDGSQAAKGCCALFVPTCVVISTIILSLFLALLFSTHLIIKPAQSSATQNSTTRSLFPPPLGWLPPGVPGSGGDLSKRANASYPGTVPNSALNSTLSPPPLPPRPPLLPPPPSRPPHPPHPPPPPPTVPLPLTPGRSNRPLQQIFNYTKLQRQNWEDRYLPCENHTDWRTRRVVKIYGKAKGPTWRGWGTTLSWWARIVTHYTPEMYRQLMDVVFSREHGLGLNMVRYQIPGSYNSSLSPRVTNSPLQSQGFRADPAKPYDWTQDERQKKVLVDTKGYDVDTYDAIAYSPPWWMTISGDISGREGGKANFRSEYSEEYAQYLTDVLDHFKRDPKLGIEFESVAPFNEALEGWWVDGRDKEGCGFEMDDVASVTVDLVNALARKNVTAGVSIADCWTGTTQSFLTGGWTGQLAPEAQAAAARLSVHGYMTPAPDGQTLDRVAYTNLQQTAAAVNKEIFQTEWGPLGYHGTELQLAVLMARVVCQHVNYMGVSAWYLWQVIQQKNGGGWGAIQVPGNVYRKDINPVILPKFYAMKQLATWVRPGSTPMVVEEACGSGFLASYDGYRQYLSVTVVNQRFKHIPFSLDTTEYVPNDGTPRAWRRVDVFRTSGSENATLIDQYMVQVPGFIDMVSSGLTITTLVLHGVKPLS